MPQISNQKIQKIKEQILYYLYSISPKQAFTSKIAQEIARDEEFTKKILLIMEKEKLVSRIQQNPQGIKYQLRLKWRISNRAYEAYSNQQ